MDTTEHVAFTLTSRDGYPLSGHYWMPPTSKAIIAVIHGLGEHCGRYERFASAAAAQGFGVVALDLRGHGRSFGERIYVDRFSDYLLDADALMSVARKLSGGLPLFLMGHSMGGAVAMRWVAERQPNLAGLILSSAALKIGPDVSTLLLNLAPILSKFAPHLRVKNLDPNAISRDPEEVEKYRNDPLVCHLPTPARTGAELLWAIESNRNAAHIQTIPIYLFHGDADTLTDPDGSRELYAKWGCPDKTLRIWPGSKHEALNDQDRDEVMGELFEWVDLKVEENTSEEKLQEDARWAVAKATVRTSAPKGAQPKAALPKSKKPAATSGAVRRKKTTPAPSAAAVPAQESASSTT